MPVTTLLGTNITSPLPPQIDIKVSNGGPGLGVTALVTVHVTWDPTVMSFGSVVAPTARVTTTNSSCTWSDYGIAWGSPKVFKLVLYRKSGITVETYVIATATDTRYGDWDTNEWPVPAGHPQEP